MNMKKIVVSLLGIGLVVGIGLFLYKNIDQLGGEARCGSNELPCNYEDIDEEAFNDGIDVMLGAQEMVDSGSDITEVIDYINNETDLADLKVGLEGIVFQPVGGPMLVVEAENNEYSGQTDVTEMNLESENKEVSFKFTNTAYAQEEENELSVTGADEGKDTREQKQALVLAPYQWEFGANDDGPVVRDILSSNRNFAGGVTYKANTTEGQNSITIMDFLNWDEYEVIHVSSHGLYGCRQPKEGEVEIVSSGDSNLCATLLDTGFKFKDENSYKEAYDKWKGIPGVGLSKTSLYLGADFFSLSGGSKLENSVVSFSACEMGVESDMQEALVSLIENGDFFFWTRTVNSGDALAAFQELYSKAVDEKIYIGKVYNDMAEGLKTGLPSSIDVAFKDEDGVWQDQEIETTTDFKHIEIGQSQHLPETITMLDPDDESIIGGGVYEFVGQYGDDDPEQMNIIFEMEGYSLDEMSEEGMTLSFSVNEKEFISKVDVESETSDNPKFELMETGESSVKVKVTDLEIMALEENESVSFEAYMNFSNGEYGYHSAEVMTSLPDIRAYSRDGFIEAIYDNDTKSYKGEVEGNVIYMDENYMYAQDQNGWIGVSREAAGGSITGMEFGNNMTLGDDFINMGNSPLFGYPVVDLTVKAQQSNFAAATDKFESSEVSCNQGTCTRYDGLTADGQGYVVFDSSGRLVEYTALELNVVFEYGDYTVNVPDATILQVPSNFPTAGNLGNYNNFGMGDMNSYPDMPDDMYDF